MAFAIGGANVPNLPWLTPALTPRVPDTHAALALPALQRRQNESSSAASASVDLFIDSTDANWEYAASIIEACADQTVYALQCTAGGSLVGAQTCGPNAVTATVTAGTSTYRFSSDVTTTTLGVGVTATAEESCVLDGTTAATCTATVRGTADGTKTTTTTTTTLSGTAYYRFDVAITGGAEKTVTATATCGSGSGAKSAAANPRPRSMLLWAVVGFAAAGAISIQSMF
ncbi:hypothetical protein BUE80_DR000823 [Diplocarpon rosae]|nr:hypothetical protein BUE80_DR000823 [Diplocarpon rosae]